MQLENSMFIISIDVDVGSKELGLINKGKNDANVNKYISEYSVGEIEERAFPLFVDLFDDFEIPVSFAMRGQLTEIDSFNWKLLRESSVRYDIGAHGYYHRRFENLSRNDAESELKMISLGMKKLGIIPRSFIFPNDSVAHLNLLEKYGYKCYRSYGNFKTHCMYIERHGRLYDIHPSLYVDRSLSSLFLKKIVDIAVAKRLPFHIWFHLWNFGETNESIEKSTKKLFFPLLNYAKKKEKSGELTFETMLSAAEKVEKLDIQQIFQEQKADFQIR